MIIVHHKSKSESESSFVFRVGCFEECVRASSSKSESLDGSNPLGSRGDVMANDNINKASNSKGEVSLSVLAN